jgi:hypothetical protein
MAESGCGCLTLIGLFFLAFFTVLCLGCMGVA